MEVACCIVYEKFLFTSTILIKFLTADLSPNLYTLQFVYFVLPITVNEEREHSPKDDRKRASNREFFHIVPQIAESFVHKKEIKRTSQSLSRCI